MLKTDVFDNWLKKLRDTQAKARILARIDRLSIGNLGDVKPVGSGVSELRIHCGPGYRVYFKNYAAVTILLLCGGDKSSQQKDIEQAIRLAGEWENKS